MTDPTDTLSQKLLVSQTMSSPSQRALSLVIQSGVCIIMCTVYIPISFSFTYLYSGEQFLSTLAGKSCASHLRWEKMGILW